MAFDAAQILRQTYAAGAEAAQMRELAEPARASAPAVQRGELMGTAFTVEADPMAELMDSMEELSFQFEEKEAKRVGERKMGEMQGPRTALLKAVESWMAMMPDMPGREFLAGVLRNMRAALSAGNPLSERELLKELSRGSTDPSHQFAMLDILEQALGEGEDALRALVRQAKATLTAEKGAEIRRHVPQRGRGVHEAAGMFPFASRRARRGGAQGRDRLPDRGMRRGPAVVVSVDGGGGARPHPDGPAVRAGAADGPGRVDRAWEAHGQAVRRDVPSRRRADGRTRPRLHRAVVRRVARNRGVHRRLRVEGPAWTSPAS